MFDSFLFFRASLPIHLCWLKRFDENVRGKGREIYIYSNAIAFINLTSFASPNKQESILDKSLELCIEVLSSRFAKLYFHRIDKFHRKLIIESTNFVEIETEFVAPAAVFNWCCERRRPPRVSACGAPVRREKEYSSISWKCFVQTDLWSQSSKPRPICWLWIVQLVMFFFITFFCFFVQAARFVLFACVCVCVRARTVTERSSVDALAVVYSQRQFICSFSSISFVLFLAPSSSSGFSRRPSSLADAQAYESLIHASMTQKHNGNIFFQFFCCFFKNIFLFLKSRWSWLLNCDVRDLHQVRV